MNQPPVQIVTIDGPAGAGKSTISRALAKILGFTYIDTGAMYRTIALAATRAGCPLQDEERLREILPSLQLTFQQVGDQRHIFLNNQDVEQDIRRNEISLGASVVSKHPSVRDFLLDQQRALGKANPSVLEGRDTGSVVFPNAPVKFYLDASADERARRRLEQLGPDQALTHTQIRKQIEERDRADQQRKIAPLICPEDAVRIDSSHLSPEQVLQQMLDITRQRLSLSH